MRGHGRSQWWKVRSSTGAVSSTTWLMFLAMNSLWFVYAVAVGNVFLGANSAGSVALNVALLHRLRVRQVVMFGAAAGTAAVGYAVGAVAGLAALPFGCLALAVTLRWPQVVKLLRTGSTAGVSVVTWCLSTVNNLVWVAIGVTSADVFLASVNGAVAATNLEVIGAYVRANRPVSR